MTITTEVIKAGPFNGNDVTTSFAFASKTTAKGDLRVVWVDTAGTESNLVLDTDYSVSLNADQNVSPGGTVTYPISGDPLATGETLTILNEPTYTRGSDLRAGTGADVIEDALDRLTILTQRSRETDGRTITIPVSDPSSVDTELPAKDDRLDKYLYFDSNGDVSAVTASLIGSAVGVDETDTDTTKNKMTSNNLAKRAEEAFNALDGTTNFTKLDVDNLTLDGNAITSTDAAGDITITPDTTGDLVLDGLKWPQADGAANQLLKTDGAAQIGYISQSALLYPPAFINGLILSNGTDATNDIDIAAGACVDSTDAVNMVLAATLTKQIDANWAVGDDAGGFPSGLTLTNDTWYHVFLIRRSDTGVVDAGFDTSITATNLLTDATNYDSYRRIGSIRRETAANQLFRQSPGGHIDYEVWPLSTNPATGNLTIQTPPDVACLAHMIQNVNTPNAASGTATLRRNIGSSVIDTGGGYQGSGTASGDNGRFISPIRVMTDTSSQIHNIDASSGTIGMYVTGYTDFRGQN